MHMMELANINLRIIGSFVVQQVVVHVEGRAAQSEQDQLKIAVLIKLNQKGYVELMEKWIFLYIVSFLPEIEVQVILFKLPAVRISSGLRP